MQLEGILYAQMPPLCGGLLQQQGLLLVQVIRLASLYGQRAISLH